MRVRKSKTIGELAFNQGPDLQTVDFTVILSYYGVHCHSERCSFIGYIKVVGKAHPNVRYPKYSLLPVLLPHNAIVVSFRVRGTE